MKTLQILSVVAAIIAVSHSGPAPTPRENGSVMADNDPMWIANIEHGIASFGDANGYQVYRNVMDFGCKGDGIADDTACINTAISSGGRCGQNCGSSTIVPALVYFPSGTYKVRSPIIMYYYTQLVGNAKNPPVLLADPAFQGFAVIDSNPYGDGGNNWYTNQNNFFRQVRNFVIDTTATPSGAGTTGIHWQVAQATSLVHITFKMTPGSQHQGIWMENGSGGFMSDLTFQGGKFGMWVGNQQFLSRNMKFDGCATAIYMNWNWQWTFKNVNINNCGIGIEAFAPADDIASGVGSILVLDSTISNTPIGIKTAAHPNSGIDTSGTILIDNLQLNNVQNAVVDTTNAVLLAGGTTNIASWGRGSIYQDKSGKGRFATGNLPVPNKSGNLLEGGKFFEKSRPQYEGSSVNDFISVKVNGARGDGNTDDADAIQRTINSAGGKIVYFPAGSYVIGKTINVTPGTRIIGETWSVLMAGGNSFQNEMSPQPMFRVGEPGQTGVVEITDIMFSTKGAQPGAILVQWNIKGSSAGAAGMWDTHFRVGGFKGSELQTDKCPKGGAFKTQCIGAHTLLHVTTTGSGYFENVWAWTADHDLDNNVQQGQVSLYTGRGVLVESIDGPVWLYGTQSEHNVFYQYQLDNTKNVFMTMIQGETPYWQPGPALPAPFNPNPAFKDPTYAHCQPGSFGCGLSWGLRAVKSSNVYLYGAGLYNFFNNYDQTCLDTESCQDGMVSLEDNTNLYMYNVNTKASTNMVMAHNTQILATQADNRNGFCQTINAFLAEA